MVFEACRQFGTAVEINSRPERLDPPKRLLSLAVEMGCMFSIDTDAHAPGQLDWQAYGCERAEDCGVTRRPRHQHLGSTETAGMGGVVSDLEKDPAEIDVRRGRRWACAGVPRAA